MGHFDKFNPRFFIYVSFKKRLFIHIACEINTDLPTETTALKNHGKGFHGCISNSITGVVYSVSRFVFIHINLAECELLPKAEHISWVQVMHTY